MSHKDEVFRRANVMMAFGEGKPVESKLVHPAFEDVWGIDFDPIWNWAVYDYRVVPDKVVTVEVEITMSELAMLLVVMPDKRELLNRLRIGERLTLKLREELTP